MKNRLLQQREQMHSIATMSIQMTPWPSGIRFLKFHFHRMKCRWMDNPRTCSEPIAVNSQSKSVFSVTIISHCVITCCCVLLILLPVVQIIERWPLTKLMYHCCFQYVGFNFAGTKNISMLIISSPQSPRPGPAPLHLLTWPWGWASNVNVYILIFSLANNTFGNEATRQVSTACDRAFSISWWLCCQCVSWQHVG